MNSKIGHIVSFDNRSDNDKAHAMTRVFSERNTEPSSTNPFHEDKARIEASAAWHRLEGLCQFRPVYDSSVQNRLTHTVCAENVGETIATNLGLCQESVDLVKAIVAAHDIGHAPFAHRGERAFQNKLNPYGTVWNHDTAGLRVIHEWEQSALSPTGLNLTLGVVEGSAKRYWRFSSDQPFDNAQHDLKELPKSIREIDNRFDLRLNKFNPIEGQIAPISDWIAFTSTDLEDGLKLGVFSFQEITDIFPFASDILAQFKMGQMAITGRDETAKAAQLISQKVRNFLIDDVVSYTANRIEAFAAQGLLRRAEDVRSLDEYLVGFSHDTLALVQKFDALNWDKAKAIPREERVPYQNFVETMIDAFVSGEIPMTGKWQAARADILRDTNLTDARLTELACVYMTNAVTDRDVINFVEKHRPQLHEKYTQFGTKPYPGLK